MLTEAEIWGIYLGVSGLIAGLSAISLAIFIPFFVKQLSGLDTGTFFLQFVLNDTTKQKISSLGVIDETFHIDETQQNFCNFKITRDILGEGKVEWDKKNLVRDMKKNPRNFMYYLTLKGFLLFLLGTERNGISNRRINRVITSVMENKYTKNDYPFLWNYDILDKIEGKYFKIELLQQIAKEAGNLLFRKDDDFLRYLVTSQFHTAISRRYGGIGSLIIPTIIKSQNNNINLPHFMKWIDEYDKKMLQYYLQYLEQEQAYVTSLLKSKETKKSSQDK